MAECQRIMKNNFLKRANPDAAVSTATLTNAQHSSRNRNGMEAVSMPLDIVHFQGVDLKK
jgi:hypothetical protein